MDKHKVIIKTILILPESWRILFYGKLNFTQNINAVLHKYKKKSWASQVMQTYDCITWETGSGLWIQGHRWDCLQQNKNHARINKKKIRSGRPTPDCGHWSNRGREVTTSTDYIKAQEILKANCSGSSTSPQTGRDGGHHTPGWIVTDHTVRGHPHTGLQNWEGPWKL